MLHKRACITSLLAALMMVVSFAVRAGEVSNSEVEQLKKDIESLRKRLNEVSAAPVKGSAVEKALESKYGPNATVTTKSGKLTIGGLLQVWYQTFQKDSEGLFQNSDAGIFDTNEASDNSSFRVRRAELKFTMDIHENVTAVIGIDPASEISSFPNVVDNQINRGYVFKGINNVEATYAANNDVPGSTTAVSNVQTGAGTTPRLLKDAYINYHGVLPHHDFTIGQFIPFVGEEGLRSSAMLDFVERSFVGLMTERRDLGVTLHGTWWDDRFQYWFGAFNGAGNFFGTAGDSRNRADDNDKKDFSYRLMVRPVWNMETWGSLELGASGILGFKGESGGRFPLQNPVNGLNRESNAAFLHDFWLSYRPGAVVRGLWLRAEYQIVIDRNAPGSIVDLGGNGTSDNNFVQENGRSFQVDGLTTSIGYKISDSVFCDSAPSWLKPFEFAVRYQYYKNVLVAEEGGDPNHTDAYYTSVITGGINYYIKGHNAKIQLNYNAVNNPDFTSDARSFHSVNNNSFVVNFQVAF